MTATAMSGNKDNVKIITPNSSAESFVDIEHYRKLVRNFIDLRRYQTALFWAEKVVRLNSDDPNWQIDIYWQAQCMFLLKEYHRAAYIIKSKGLEKTHLLCHYLIVESLLEAKEYPEAMDILNSVDLDELAGSTIKLQKCGEFTIGDDGSTNEVLASICFLKGKVLEAMDNRGLAMDCYVLALQKSVYCTEALDALIQHEMLMAWEEKELMQHLPIAQQCTESEGKVLQKLYESKLKKYYDSISPVTNAEQTPIGNFSSFQSFREISEKIRAEKTNELKIGRNNRSKLLTPGQIIMSPANKILNDLRNTPSYSIQSSLSKISILNESNSKTPDTSQKVYRKPSTIEPKKAISLNVCIQRLEESVDLIVAQAEKHFYSCEYKKCLKLLDDVLKKDPFQTKGLTIQIGCLAELKDFNKLFYVAHKLVDLYPDQAISWYAVGCYYDAIGKSDPARRYLSKATSLDRLFGPAWLAYGHSFARENEHDQAMAAYFKATQLMRGCHLPLLYIGVECGLTKNLELAEKFFYQAMSIAPLDVFVLHELGVIKFEYAFYPSAEEVFRTTLEMVTSLAKTNKESISARWEPLLNNLGHCCRKNKKYKEALDFHRRALILKPQSATTYTAIGFVQTLMGKLEDAVDSLHKSLSLKRDDVFATTLLKYTIEDLMEENSLGDIDLDNPEILEPTPKFLIDVTAEEEEIEKPKLNRMQLNFDDFDNSEHTTDKSVDMSMET